MDRRNPWPLGLCSLHHLRPVLFLAAFFPPSPGNFSETSHSYLLQTSNHWSLRFTILWFTTIPHHKYMTEPFVAAATGTDHPSPWSFFSPTGFREVSMAASRDRKGVVRREEYLSRSIGNDLDGEGALHRGQLTTACQIRLDHFDVHIFARVRIRRRTRTT